MDTFIYWDIYEITTQGSSIHGVMLRGSIRKFALDKGLNLLTENATDKENTVRFALENNSDSKDVIAFVKNKIDDSTVILVQEKVPNPVLSKLKVNKEDRYI